MNATATLEKPQTLLDPDDPIMLRTYYESLRGQLEADRSTWEDQWSQCAAFFDPYSPSWDYSDTNIGSRRDYSIINETGLLAHRTLKAGMLNGMSPPSGKWLKIGVDDAKVNMVPAVRQWCEAAQEAVYKTMLGSNFYDCLLELYGEEGLYGTSAMLIREDKKTKIRCYPMQIGRYFLTQDAERRVSLALTVLYMTVDQIVSQFGFDKVSSQVRAIYNSGAGGNKETRLPIVHVIHRSDYFKPPVSGYQWAWTSCYYEMGAYNEKLGLLSCGGFDEDALVVGRWVVKGENVYGFGCGLDVLGSVMSLQAWEERVALAVDKQLDPPMVAGTGLDPRMLTTQPGGILFGDERDPVFKPAYQVDFRVEGGNAMIQRIEARINDGMYRSLFQMFTDSDRREMTAEEVREKARERMQVLGPVVERNVMDVLAPSVRRTLRILMRIPGALPPMPEAMKRARIKMEFESILVQAQKLRSLTNLTQFMAIVNQESPIQQDVLDIVDPDEYVREAARLTDVPNKILRTKEDVAKIRADRQQAQKQQQAAENAKNLAPAIAAASNAKTGDGESLLEKTLPAVSGGAPGPL